MKYWQCLGLRKTFQFSSQGPALLLFNTLNIAVKKVEIFF